MIALEAIDSDVIKTYVRLGLGVGIVAEMAVRDDPRGRRPGVAPGGPPVRPERRPRRLRARRLPARLRLCLRRTAVRPAHARADPARDERRQRGRLSNCEHHDCPSPFAHPGAAQPPAARRHHHLHRHVGAGAGTRRGQPGPGLPGFRLRSRSCSTMSAPPCARASTSTRRWPACCRCARRSPHKMQRLYGRAYDAQREVTITAGATQAILTAMLCCVHPGDEVIVLEPCYDSYAPNIELAGGARGARAADARHLPARLRRHRGGAHAAHAADDRQLAAQPQRHGVERGRDAAARRRCWRRPTCC